MNFKKPFLSIEELQNNIIQCENKKCPFQAKVSHNIGGEIYYLCHDCSRIMGNCFKKK